VFETLSMVQSKHSHIALKL